MPVSPPHRLPLILAGLLAATMAIPAQAAEAAHHVCLSKAEQRVAVAHHRAVSLGTAISSARRHRKKAEVLRARLCGGSDGLFYVLTLLGHNGKVTRIAIDAANGKLIKNR
jgi:uncharacterized membrane protein YkoI